MPESTKDVEMKGKKEEETKEPKKETKPQPKDPRTLLVESAVTTLRVIRESVLAGDSRGMARVVRSLNLLRRTMTPEVLKVLVAELVETSRRDAMLACISLLKEPDVEMVDAKADDEPKEKAEIKFGLGKPQTGLNGPHGPECEAFAGLLVLVKMIDEKCDKDRIIDFGSNLVLWLKTHNRRTLDSFQARAYFYLSLSFEKAGRLSELRSELLAAYRTACLRHDAMGQATLLNLLLRNYIQYNLYEQAMKLVGKARFPDIRPNAQYARYLFHLGQIKAVQLEYSDSYKHLMQAIRKSPQAPSVALGFKLAAHKLVVIVELLMGDIPDRAVFMQAELKEQLRPYYAIAQAVRSGDLRAFGEVIDRHSQLFKKDKTLTLINRLRYNVIKAGLRSINLSYSRISLKDICTKLGLETPQDAAGVVAKAVVDGVIDATIDHDEQFLKSTQKHEPYASCEPQKAFHKRIAFCLALRNDAVKAMVYPDENDSKAKDAEARLAREMEDMVDVDDLDDDMMF